MKYKESLKNYRDINNIVETSRQEGRLEGRLEGRKEGRKEGKEEGRKEGKEEGRKERDYEIALKMQKEGFTPQQISKITNLSIDEIEQLQHISKK